MSCKAIYKKRRAEHRCGNCGRQDDRTLSGKSTCEKCNLRSLKYIEEHRELHNACAADYMNKRYYRLRNSRCCTECGKPLPGDYFYVTCPACREKMRNRKKKKTA